MDEPLFNELLESVKQADQIMTDHAELRRLAKAATPGPWEYQAPLKILAADRTSIVLIALSHANYREDEANSRLIAAANPKTILALLDEIDRLKAENEALLLGMRAILNAYDYADQYNKEGVAVEVMEDLRTLFKGATQ
ncbi:ead/Ea22-like family protein [Pseudomonas aeruginosa]